MESKLTHLLQIGIIVDDLDKVIKNYEEIGIAGWEVTYLESADYLADLTLNGKSYENGDKILKVALLQAYGLEIELIEPILDCVYKDWLEEHGPGLHHVAMKLKDGYDETLDWAKEKTGKDPWVRGVAIGGMLDFSYLDLRNELGLIVECYKNPTPGKDGLPFDINKKGE